MSSAAYLPFVNNYNLQTQNLNKSMKRLATGKRFVTPGDAPADVGIAERLELQIRNSQTAADVMQNGVNMLQSIDAWQQSAIDMLGRMSELAIGATDSSKSEQDRINMEAEFQSLRQEIAHISEDSKFNGLLINSKTAVAVYDTIDKKIVYTQGDGSDQRTIEILLRNGNTSINSIPYCFETPSGVPGEFMLINNGEDIVYVAQTSDATTSVTALKTIMKLNIATNTITKMDVSTAAANAVDQTAFAMDESGNVWISYMDSAAAGFRIARLDAVSMTLDFGTSSTSKWTAQAAAGSPGYIITATGFPRFSVHEGRVYYIQSAAGKKNLVSQNLTNAADQTIIEEDLSGNYSLTSGHKYAFSSDGGYLAWASQAGVGADAVSGNLSVLNVETQQRTTQSMGTDFSTLASLGFDRNNRLFFTDTGSSANQNAVRRVDIGLAKDGITPTFTNQEVIRNGVAGRFGLPAGADTLTSNAGKYPFGLSVGGDSPAVKFTFQVGPDSGMVQTLEGADLRATNLGLSKSSIKTIEKAQVAQKAIEKAVEKISEARALIGAQVSRLQFTMAANENYISNIATTKASIIDTDMADETAKMTQFQLRQMASTSMLTNFNQQQTMLVQSLLR